MISEVFFRLFFLVYFCILQALQLGALTHLYVSRSHNWYWISLVVQWLGIHLPLQMQGTQVWSLVWDDPTCHGASKPVHYNCWACALEPGSHNYWSPHTLEPGLRNRRNHRSKKPSHCNESSPCLPQQEQSLSGNKDPAQPRIHK